MDDGFESHFGMAVWYACFPPAEPRLCYLFRNRALMGRAVIHDPERQTIRVPVALGFAVEHVAVPFSQALLQAGAVAPAA